jgi:hypothetical protein
MQHNIDSVGLCLLGFEASAASGLPASGAAKSLKFLLP